MQITFRPMVDDDLPLLHEWLNEPGVVEWWEGEDVTWGAVVADYGSDNPDPVDYFFALDAAAGDRPFAWIQTYAVADFAHEAETRAWFDLGYPVTGAGIDYLVGDPGERGGGRGSAMIRAFVDQIVWPDYPERTHVAASPVRANVASCRALVKAGFELAGSFDDDELGPCDLHVLARPATTPDPAATPPGLRG